MYTRRRFLKDSFLISGAFLFDLESLWARESGSLLTSAVRGFDGTYGLGIVNLITQEEYFISVPQRCHSMALSRINSQILFFDRRPGQSFYVVSARSFKVRQVVEAPTQYRFYGHGCFSLDERYLFVTANHLKTFFGTILVYDSKNNYELVDRFSSGGIGPHEVVRHPVKDILYICNGGLKTHPDSGRKILNLESMNSNLTILPINSRESLSHFSAPSSKLSLRHLSVNAHGDAVVGFQDKDFFPGDNKPLVGFYTEKTKTFSRASVSEELFTLSKGYVASVAMDEESKRAVVTCPKSGKVILWDIKSEQPLEVFNFQGAAGACFDHLSKQFIITSDQGEVKILKANTLTAFGKYSFQWDNHSQLY